MEKGKVRTLPLDVYFDYLCPYCYRAAVWLQKVKEEMGEKLTINWKYFSLEQVNSQQGPRWKVWEHPTDYPSQGLPAFWAAEAARQQGEDAFSAFHLALLKARHEEGKDIASINTLIEVAKSAGLEIARFQRELRDRRLLAKLAQDHTQAVATLGIFGTPTLVFPEEQAIFLKLSSLPSLEESLPIFTELRRLAEQRRYIQEVKRPRPQT